MAKYMLFKAHFGVQLQSVCTATKPRRNFGTRDSITMQKPLPSKSPISHFPSKQFPRKIGCFVWFLEVGIYKRQARGALPHSFLHCPCTQRSSALPPGCGTNMRLAANYSSRRVTSLRNSTTWRACQGSSRTENGDLMDEFAKSTVHSQNLVVYHRRLRETTAVCVRGLVRIAEV